MGAFTKNNLVFFKMQKESSLLLVPCNKLLSIVWRWQCLSMCFFNVTLWVKELSQLISLLIALLLL